MSLHHNSIDSTKIDIKQIETIKNNTTIVYVLMNILRDKWNMSALFLRLDENFFECLTRVHHVASDDDDEDDENDEHDDDENENNEDDNHDDQNDDDDQNNDDDQKNDNKQTSRQKNVDADFEENKSAADVESFEKKEKVKKDDKSMNNKKTTSSRRRRTKETMKWICFKTMSTKVKLFAAVLNSLAQKRKKSRRL